MKSAMPTRALWSFALLAAIGLSLCLGGRAHAQDTSYDDLVADALAEFRSEHYIESRTLFRRAHELRASARTLRGMGQSAFRARMYGQAIVDLSAAIENKVNALTPKLREEAEAIIARARAYCGRFRVTLDPDAELTVDGGPAVFDHDGTLLLDVGTRQLIVRAQGMADRELTIRVVGGEEKTLALSTALASASPPGDGSAAPTVAPEGFDSVKARRFKPTAPRLPEPEVERPFPWLATSAFGLAAVGVGVGIYFMNVSGKRQNSWSVQGCARTPSDICTWFQTERQKAITREVISFSLAGALTATGVVLLLVRGSEDSDSALACGTMGEIGISCRLRM